MSKFRHYIPPKKPFNPRAVHLYDLAALALALVIALTVMPIGTVVDVSAGIGKPSEAYPQADTKALEEFYQESTTSAKDFKDYFETSCLQNGGYVYENGYGTYLYLEGDQGAGYYLSKDGKTKKRDPIPEGGNPRGLFVRGGFLSVLDNGQIYLDDMDGSSGPLEQWAEIPDTLDYQAVTQSLLRSSISCQDTAVLWRLIQQERLVGFNGSEAWFHETEGDLHRFYRAYGGLPPEERFTLTGDMWDVMVINDRYLVYGQEGNLHIYCIETGEHTQVTFGAGTDLGELTQIGYRVDGSSIRIYAMSTGTPSYYDLTGNGVEIGQSVMMENVDGSQVSGMFPTKYRSNTTLWLQEPAQYTPVGQN